jgi:hypothetical protein
MIEQLLFLFITIFPISLYGYENIFPFLFYENNPFGLFPVLITFLYYKS